ncbi:MAG: dipeptidase [Steroidobacteraceae bacterium]|nr:dipeptidase [Steroidobacteraceae bacterium]
MQYAVRSAFLTLTLVFAASACSADASESESLQHARRLLRETILIDGHNDLPWVIRTHEAARGDVKRYDISSRVPGQTDLERLRQGGVGAQFWSVYTPSEAPGGFARTQLEQIDIARRMIERYPEALQLATSAADVRDAHRNGRIASMLGVEGGHAIENSLGALRAYYDLGVRYMTLTHNSHTDWADSAAQAPKHDGLTEFGEKVVLEMNRLGMLVDLSHTSDATAAHAMRISKAPVIFSHSSARALCDVPRNVPDHLLRQLADNGGVVMATFVAGFVDPEVSRIQMPAIEEAKRRAEGKSAEERSRIYAEIMDGVQIPTVSLSKVADHIEHIREAAGVEHIGIGADYDGNDLWPEKLSDVSGYPYLFAELIRRGWSDRELQMLAGENVLRVMAQAEDVARKMRNE